MAPRNRTLDHGNTIAARQLAALVGKLGQQKVVAQEAGVHQSTVSEILRGGWPSSTTARKIGEAYRRICKAEPAEVVAHEAPAAEAPAPVVVDATLQQLRQRAGNLRDCCSMMAEEVDAIESLRQEMRPLLREALGGVAAEIKVGLRALTHAVEKLDI